MNIRNFLLNYKKLIGKFKFRLYIMITKETILDQNELLRIILDNTEEIVWVVDTSYGLQYGNKSFFKALSHSEMNVMEIGKSVLNPDNSPEMTQYWKSCYDRCLADESFELDLPVPWKNGLHYMRNMFHPLKDSLGNVIGVNVFTHDITNRIQSEQALKESEEMFRLIFDHAGEAIFFTNPDGTIELANPEACRIFGYTNEEFRQLGREGVIDQKDPRYQEALNFRSQHKEFKGELNFIKKDGTLFPCEIVSNIFIDSKGHEKSSIILKDISERISTKNELVESELKYRLLFENINYGVEMNEVITDENNEPVDFRIIEANKYFKHFSGLSPEEVIGKKITEVMPNADDFMIKTYGQVALTGIPIDLEYFSNTFQKFIRVHVFVPRKDILLPYMKTSQNGKKSKKPCS